MTNDQWPHPTKWEWKMINFYYKFTFFRPKTRLIFQLTYINNRQLWISAQAQIVWHNESDIWPTQSNCQMYIMKFGCFFGFFFIKSNIELISEIFLLLQLTFCVFFNGFEILILIFKMKMELLRQNSTTIWKLFKLHAFFKCKDWWSHAECMFAYYYD